MTNPQLDFHIKPRIINSKLAHNRPTRTTFNGETVLLETMRPSCCLTLQSTETDQRTE